MPVNRNIPLGLIINKTVGLKVSVVEKKMKNAILLVE
jgi:hypothetical protein